MWYSIKYYLLWTLQIPMYNLMVVQIGHALGNLLSPLEDLLGRTSHAAAQKIIQRPILTELHYDAVNRWLAYNPLETYDVLVIQFPKMFKICFALILESFYGDHLAFQHSTKNKTLCSRPEVCQLSYLGKWNLPSICKTILHIM